MRVPAQLQKQQFTRIYLQTGLEVLQGLPAGTEVVHFGAGLEEVLQTWKRSPPRSADMIVFNIEHTPEGSILTAALPLAHPMPALLRTNPKEWDAIAYAKLVIAVWVARQLGAVLDLRTLSVNFLQVGPSTYAIIRSA